MPYRIDLSHASPDEALDRLVTLGALDVAFVDGRVAALIPDSTPPKRVASVLGVESVAISPAIGRDDGSVWTLELRPVRVGRILINPGDAPHDAGALRIADGDAFGTGLHPTTALCLELLDGIADVALPTRVLDVGTGSGVLALAALMLGVAEATALDIDPEALEAAARNADLNHLTPRFHLQHGSAGDVEGVWPLVLANIAAAPLMEMAPTLVRRVASRGQLILSGIPVSVAREVDQVYRRLGMRSRRTVTRAGWAALLLMASW